MTSCLTRYTHPAKTYMGKASLGAPVNLEEGLLQTDPRFPPQVHRKLDFTSSGDYGAICWCRKSLLLFFFPLSLHRNYILGKSSSLQTL